MYLPIRTFQGRGRIFAILRLVGTIAEAFLWLFAFITIIFVLVVLGAH